MQGDILVVDDDASLIQLVARMLRNTGRVRFATNGTDALRIARESPPDLILLDAELPGMSGFETCEALKADPATADCSVIFVTSHREAEFELAGFARGAADFIAKPVSEPLLLARVRTQLRVKQMADELRRLSTTDALTGLANRRRLDERLAVEWARALRGHALALLLVDVDHFKRYNDHYGHAEGDSCLRQVAAALASITRQGPDLVARYGGEEFVLLLPDVDAEGAVVVSERALEAVQALRLPHAASPTANIVSISIGAASVGQWRPGESADVDLSAAAVCADVGGLGVVGAGEPVQRLLAEADRALYAAKVAGRARVVSADALVVGG